jgi:hypothetical protein
MILESGDRPSADTLQFSIVKQATNSTLSEAQANSTSSGAQVDCTQSEAQPSGTQSEAQETNTPPLQQSLTPT